MRTAFALALPVVAARLLSAPGGATAAGGTVPACRAAPLGWAVREIVGESVKLRARVTCPYEGTDAGTGAWDPCSLVGQWVWKGNASWRESQSCYSQPDSQRVCSSTTTYATVVLT